MNLLSTPRGRHLLSVHLLERELHLMQIQEHYLHIYQLHKEPTHSRRHHHRIQFLRFQFRHQFYCLRMTASISNNIGDIQTWHRGNRRLYDFLFLSTSGAAARFLLSFKPKQGEVANGKAAWGGFVNKYQNSTRQRKKCILKSQLSKIVTRYVGGARPRNVHE